MTKSPDWSVEIEYSYLAQEKYCCVQVASHLHDFRRPH